MSDDNNHLAKLAASTQARLLNWTARHVFKRATWRYVPAHIFDWMQKPDRDIQNAMAGHDPRMAKKLYRRIGKEREKIEEADHVIVVGRDSEHDIALNNLHYPEKSFAIDGGRSVTVTNSAFRSLDVSLRGWEDADNHVTLQGVSLKMGDRLSYTNIHHAHSVHIKDQSAVGFLVLDDMVKEVKAQDARIETVVGGAGLSSFRGHCLELGQQSDDDLIISPVMGQNDYNVAFNRATFEFVAPERIYKAAAVAPFTPVKSLAAKAESKSGFIGLLSGQLLEEEKVLMTYTHGEKRGVRAGVAAHVKHLIGTTNGLADFQKNINGFVNGDLSASAARMTFAKQALSGILNKAEAERVMQGIDALPAYTG